MRRLRSDAGGSGQPAGRRWLVALFLSLFLAGASAGPVLADDYDRKAAGNPVRIAAYILHPIGVALDYLILRPAHWIGSHEPFKTIFGHED